VRGEARLTLQSWEPPGGDMGHVWAVRHCAARWWVVPAHGSRVLACRRRKGPGVEMGPHVEIGPTLCDSPARRWSTKRRRCAPTPFRS
jgi:hypothetical protein